MLGSTEMDFGADRLSTVADDYVGPFAFTGILSRVSFEVRGKRDRERNPPTPRDRGPGWLRVGARRGARETRPSRATPRSAVWMSVSD